MLGVPQSPTHPQYVRQPRKRARRETWCIWTLPNGSYGVQIWIPGTGRRYIGTYPTLEKAMEERDIARREAGLMK